MESLHQLISELEKLVKSDSEASRELIATILSRFLNEEYENYKQLSSQIQDLISEMGIMAEIDGRKEPKILHMNLNEIKSILQELKVHIMVNITKIEFVRYDKDSRALYFKIFLNDGGGPAETGFSIGSAEEVYVEMYDFLENTLNPALISEQQEEISLESLDREKTIKYLNDLLELANEIETNKEKMSITEYMERKEKLAGFSIDFE